jgi:DNA invertase Pin-like site-specific DNA recombinase
MERRHSLITHNDRFPNVADPHLTPAAQREACEAYVVSQRHAGWVALADMYDDGGLSGGTMERPALKRLLEDIKADKVQIVVVYKVDRPARSLSVSPKSSTSSMPPTRRSCP